MWSVLYTYRCPSGASSLRFSCVDKRVDLHFVGRRLAKTTTPKGNDFLYTSTKLVRCRPVTHKRFPRRTFR